MAERARPYRATFIDFGTGDGAFAFRTARLNPDLLVIGVDAVADNLREASRRAAGKSSRGGLANVLFGRLALEDAPGSLEAIADRLTIILPWGSLLAAVARPDREGLHRLAAICRDGAELRVVVGYGLQTDPATTEQQLPPLADAGTLRGLEAAYADSGFRVQARSISAAQVAALPTTWAKKLAWSGKSRAYVEIFGRRIVGSSAKSATN